MMRTNVLKVVFVTLFALMATGMMAQGKGEMAVGGNLVYGTGDSYSNFGIGAKFQYGITEKIRLEPSFTYFLEEKGMNMWDLSVNAHYLFPVAPKLSVYPLAGVGVLGVDPEHGDGDTEFAINLGAGADYQLTDKLFLNAELKYKFCDWDRFLISVGVGYKF